MKHLLRKAGNYLTRVGEAHNIPFLVYNPIIWLFFLMTSRREGRIFARALKIVLPNTRTAIDVGSGGGGYVFALNQLGIQAVGYEYARIGRILGRLQGVSVHRFDCSTEISAPIDQCDAAFTIEVGEHIPQAHSDRFVDFLCGCSKLVIFSAAHPGQGGHGHINEQPKSYWERKFRDRGYLRLEPVEQALRKQLLELDYKGWLPINLQVFSRET